MDGIAGALRLEPGVDAAMVCTQGWHPFLARPAFLVHPCQTRDVMEVLSADRTARSGGMYLAAWLQFISRPLPLTVPLAPFQ